MIGTGFQQSKDRSKPNLQTNITVQASTAGRKPPKTYTSSSPQNSQPTSFRSGRRLTEDRNVNDKTSNQFIKEDNFNDNPPNKNKQSQAGTNFASRNDIDIHIGTRSRNQAKANQIGNVKSDANFDPPEQRPATNYKLELSTKRDQSQLNQNARIGLL